jgi:hypothetical protein
MVVAILPLSIKGNPYLDGNNDNFSRRGSLRFFYVPDFNE